MKIIALVCLLFGSCLAETTVEKLVGDGRFKTLVKLVTDAGLVSTLNGGNFTIFAPTDDAFAKVPADVVKQVTGDPALLTKVLTYHVVSGFVPSTAARNELVVDTVAQIGARFNIYKNMGKTVITIEGAVVNQTDLMASNGVIHVINSVMMAPSGDVVSLVAGSPNHKTLLALVQQAGIASVLQQQGITVFAPTDAAFGNVPAATLNAVKSDAQLLKNVLSYHVVNSTQYSAGLYDNELVQPLLVGKKLTVHIGGMVKINEATVTAADLDTTNGVVHVIDKVLVPPSGSDVVG